MEEPSKKASVRQPIARPMSATFAANALNVVVATKEEDSVPN